MQNGVQQGSVLAPIFLNVYPNNIPEKKKFFYADDIAILTQAKSFDNLENFSKLKKYFKKWGLKPNASKNSMIMLSPERQTVNTEMEVKFCNTILKHEGCPKYLAFANI